MKEKIIKVLKALNISYVEDIINLFSPRELPSCCIQLVNKKPIFALLSPWPTSYKYDIQILYMEELELDYLAFKGSVDKLIASLRTKVSKGQILSLKIDSKITTDKDYYKAHIKISVEEVNSIGTRK